MSDERSAGGSSGWVVEPPAEGLRVIVECTEAADVTPELRQALERLVRVIQDETAEPEEAEAAGFQVFRPRPTCPQACPKNMVCSPQEIRDCFYYSDCTIVNQPCSPALM
jgi:hypothetical protein